MPITYGQFVYGFTVTTGTSDKLDFKDAGTTYAATLQAGDYCAAEYAAEVQRAMRAITGNSNQTVTFSFSTLKFTLAGTSVFQLLFGTGANAATDCNAELGFSAADETGATSYSSDAAVGTAPSTMGLWTLADPFADGTTPVTAAVDGTAASLTQRDIRAEQHVSDGGIVETVWFSTVKEIRLVFHALTSAEQTKMELLLNWIERGRRLNYQPDSTSTNALRVVIKDLREVRNAYTWLTRSETDYGTLTFIEQASRT